MKLGLYISPGFETAGGAFVVREDLAQAAQRAEGRHSIALLNCGAPQKSGSVTRTPSMLRRMASGTVRAFRLAKFRDQTKAALLKKEATEKGIQMLWFNHTPPIDIGLPYIISVFDVLHRLQPWFPEVSSTEVWRQREAYWGPAMQRASAVILPSETTKNDVSFLYNVPLDRIRVIPFPTPTSAMEAASFPAPAISMRDKYGIARDFAMYPAQFWPHKNHANLIRAIKVLQEQHGVELDLVLTGSDHGNLAHVQKTVRDLGLERRVHFLGFVPREDLVHLYREAFALTYLSFFGPENLPPLEAQAIGCPVVIGDMRGVRSLFGESPIYVDPKDPAAIAAGIARLHDEPGLRERLIALGRTSAKPFSADQHIAAVLSILDDFEPIRRCWP